MTLVVQIPPKLEQMDDKRGTEGGPVSLECVARGDPIPNIIWEKVDTGERYSSGKHDQRITVTPKDLEDPNNLGSKLTLSFAKLIHSDAGEYRCEAKNNADTAVASVNLEVLYRPNFLDQGETRFYNWEGHTDSFIECISNANTAPSFKWYRGSREITVGDNFRIGTTVINPENDQQATSKLYVTFNGNNDDAVFGNYTCKAFNPTGENNITLTMMKADFPEDPVINIQEEDARHIVFWLYKPKVLGPEATTFKVVYKVQGSDKKAKTQLVRINDRDHADVARTYTVVTVDGLLHDTNYIFTFYTINPVGISSGKALAKTTQSRSVPKDPVVISSINSVYSDRIVVNWKIPSDGGATILEYKLIHQLINVKSNSSSDSSRGYEMLSPITPEVVISGIKDSSYTIEKLAPGKFYRVKVYARNSEGYSVPGEKIFKTKEATIVPGASSGAPSGLSTGTIIGIVIGIFVLLFIAVDVTCYFKNNCGILMSIKDKVAGGREEGYAVAETDDVENLAKKDELTEEAKAAEEGVLTETHSDEKKAPLLSEEQAVDTVDEGKPESKELEPEEKEAANAEQAKIESSTTEQAPADPKEKISATDGVQPPADQPKE